MSNKLTQLQEEYLYVLGIAVSFLTLAFMFQQSPLIFWMSLGGSIFALLALITVILMEGVATLKPVREKNKTAGVSNCSVCATGNNSNKTKIY